MSKLVKTNKRVIELDIIRYIVKQQKSHRIEVKGPK